MKLIQVDESGPRWPDSIRMRFSHRPEIGLNGTDMKWNVMKLIKQKKSKINQIKSRKKKSLAQFKLIWIVVDRLKGNWMRQCGFINRCLLVKGGSRIFHCADQFDYFFGRPFSPCLMMNRPTLIINFALISASWQRRLGTLRRMATDVTAAEHQSRRCVPRPDLAFVFNDGVERRLN